MVEICDEWEPKLQAIGFVKGAPFQTVNLTIIYGSRESQEPEFSKIDRRNRELPVAFELPMSKLKAATTDELKAMLRDATTRTLRATASKYSLPDPTLDESQR